MSLSLRGNEEQGEGLSWILPQRMHQELQAGAAGGRFPLGKRKCFPTITGVPLTGTPLYHRELLTQGWFKETVNGHLSGKVSRMK